MENEEKRYPAICTVHWPTGPVNCCEKHTNELVALGNMLYTFIAVTKLKEEAECSICKNEKY